MDDAHRAARFCSARRKVHDLQRHPGSDDIPIERELGQWAQFMGLHMLPVCWPAPCVGANPLIDTQERDMNDTAAHCRSQRRHTLTERQGRVLARVFRARMPYAMLAFLALTAAAAIPELTMYPERASSYIVVYAIEAQVWLLALTLTRNQPLSYARAVAIAMGTTLGMMTLITAYHGYTGAEAHALLIALAYVTVGAMLVFPWRPRAQLAAATSSVVAYVVGLSMGVQVTPGIGVQVTGLMIIAATTVATVCMVEQYRTRLMHLATLSYAWRRAA